MLLQIHEPGQTPLPHQDEEDIAVGIDLGTTNSLVAFSHEGKVEVISDKDGNVITPSVVGYKDGKAVLVGQYNDDKEVSYISSAKRLMGRGVNDIKKISGAIPYDIADDGQQGMVRLNIGGKKISPVEVSSNILTVLKEKAEKALGKKVKKAVITVPAYFDDAARSATKDAAKLSGLEVLRLINEPTAASLAYGIDNSAEGIYVVYDLGGGTFDVSILRMQKGVFQVIATGGNTALGGDDFDREIAEIVLWDYKNQFNQAPDLSTNELKSLLRKAKEIKEYLSNNQEGEFEVEVKGKKFISKITKEKFEQAIKPYVDATIAVCEQALEDADLTSSDILGVVMVGGSTRVPFIYDSVSKFFEKEPYNNVDPDQVVAMGAALQAEGLTKGSDNILLDVLPLSLGIETMGGIVEKVINRNTPIPVAKAQEFTTYKDGQTGLKIHVVQGEREMAEQNRSLAKFDLKGIPSMVAGAARIKVSFTVDADGLLVVSAKEETTGVEQKIEVKPSYGLEEKEIEQMLRNSMKHGKEDMALRLLTETKIEANGVVESLQNAMQQDKNLLEQGEEQKFSDKIAELNKALEGSDRDKIVSLQEDLEKISSRFIERRINNSIGQALKGKNVDEV